jgi:ACS family pantothenate transporter-like MFS transporter
MATQTDTVKAVAPDTIEIQSKEKDATSVTSATGKSAAPQAEPASGWFHWHEPGTSKEEKKLIFKLDWFLLSWSCLMFFVKQVITQTSPALAQI